MVAPPPVEDRGQSRKRRQRQGGKFRQDMAAPTVPDQPEGGRLHFDGDSAPGPPPEPDRGQLRFEDAPAPDTGTAENISTPPPPDDSSKKQRKRKQTQRFREDAASPVLADAQDGGGPGTIMIVLLAALAGTSKSTSPNMIWPMRRTWTS